MLKATGEVTPNIDYASQDVMKPEETAFPLTFRRVCTDLRLPIIDGAHHNRTEPAAQAHMQASSPIDHVQCSTRRETRNVAAFLSCMISRAAEGPKGGCEIWIYLARVVVARFATE
jgi:hypothetical protein